MNLPRSAFVLSMLLAAAVSAAAQGYSHKEAFDDYEGTKTCLECHRDEAESFFHSQHYQWKGATPNLTNGDGKKYGKINTINDFCTSPMPNWIGPVANAEGKVVAKGCSRCHAGRGLEPSQEMSEKQLENIDCLICHASGYRRDLYVDKEGKAEWKPILWKNKEGLNSVSKRISKPTRIMCLRCHSASGGGPNFKRGDIEYELKDCEVEFDVHMSTDGADLQCVDCHAGENHRVLGRGADLAATDTPGKRLSCSSSDCHDSEPHEAKALNRHTKKVDCTACHIPVFAKANPTDMVRDWSKPKYIEEKGKYSATITLQSNVVPEYVWFNGNSTAQLPEEKVRTLSDGRTVAMMMPQGSRKDKDARIYPFKLHRGKLPMLTDRKWILPIGVEEFFADGKIDKAVKEGAHKMYGIEDAEYTWVDTVRYMGIYHEVQPAKNALGCLDCHGPRGRLDWKKLGYESDPMDRAFRGD